MYFTLELWNLNTILVRANALSIEPTPPGKTRITVWLDDDILAWFRQQVHLANGGNYQTLINEALRQHIDREREPLEETVRRVVREEIARLDR